jgi:ubiquitin-protein ligase
MTAILKSIKLPKMANTTFEKLNCTLDTTTQDDDIYTGLTTFEFKYIPKDDSIGFCMDIEVVCESSTSNEATITFRNTKEYNFNFVAFHSWVNTRMPFATLDEPLASDFTITIFHDNRKKHINSNYKWTDISSILKDFIKNRSTHCIFCSKNSINNVQINHNTSICDNDDCKQQIMYFYQNDNYIESYYQNKKITTDFYIYLLYQALTSARIDVIYKPRPSFLLSENLTLQVVENLIGCKVADIIQIVSSHYEPDSGGMVKGDSQLYREYPYLYMMVRHLLNTLSKYYVINSSIKNSLPNEGVENVFEVKSEIEKNDIFDDSKNDYLFHGSGATNWLSIISNGLQVGTIDNKLFLNGAAYGKGIYLSDNANTSYTYMRSGGSADNKYCIMGVYQVAEKRETYLKTASIYVVPSPTELKLRYLVVFKGSSSHNAKMLTALTSMFGAGEIKTNIDRRNITTKQVGSRRIMKEFSKLHLMGSLSETEKSKADDDLGVIFTCELAEEDKLNVWNINFSSKNIPENTKLYAQLVEKNIDNIKMEFNFPQTYPIDPPFCRIIYPRFKFMVMNITRGGSFCNTLLTKQGWSPILTVDKVLLQIKSLMLEDEGQGELDPDSWNVPYSFEEAQTAYSRMLQSHGWH